MSSETAGLRFQSGAREVPAEKPNDSSVGRRLTANNRRTREWPWVALLFLIVALTWCGHYDRWDKWSWRNPPLIISDERWLPWKAAFSGDGLWGLAGAKAGADGEIGFFSKRPESLGAPFTASWNDWLSTEEALAQWWALLVRLFGLAPGSNLALLSTHLLAAASFYFVCRYFRYHQAIALAGAALFALSRYAFWRGLSHIGLAMYWHIPLGFLVLWWCFRGEPILQRKRRLLFCVGLAIVYGSHSAYYAVMFVQLLCGATVCAFLRSRDWRAALAPAVIVAVMVGTFVFMNVDTIAHRFLHGPHSGITQRWYFDVEKWALKPIDLLVPYTHSSAAFAEWAKKRYYDRAMILGEGGAPYLGVVAMFGLAWLLWQTLNGIARQDARAIPLHLWCIAWAFAYSVIGGLTGVVGLSNLFLVRATNRFSIFILAAALLFLARQLNYYLRRWQPRSIYVVSALLLGVGIYDQVPPRASKEAAETARKFNEDKKLVARLESQLAPGAMIFQLPVMAFPEAFGVERMIDYEPFRPYLHSTQLRFSYGDNKSRHRDRWQRETERLGAAELVRKLEEYGFSAILIDPKGYRPGISAEADLRAVGRGYILAESPDYICIELNPWRRPSLPPEFREGWHDLEGTAAHTVRWSDGNANLVLHNAEPKARLTRVRFELATLKNRTVEIRGEDDRILFHGVADPQKQMPVSLELDLPPGETKLRFITDRPGELADHRAVAFALANFNVTHLLSPAMPND